MIHVSPQKPAQFRLSSRGENHYKPCPLKNFDSSYSSSFLQSVTIPNDGAVDVPIDYSLVWNYPYKKDYSNTKSNITVTGPGVNLTKELQYPHNVFFQALEPGGTYNWSVTVDNIS